MKMNELGKARTFLVMLHLSQCVGTSRGSRGPGPHL